jgi:hypothetical protein
MQLYIELIAQGSIKKSVGECHFKKIRQFDRYISFRKTQLLRKDSALLL